jgi:hypothetical protein
MHFSCFPCMPCVPSTSLQSLSIWSALCLAERTRMWNCLFCCHLVIPIIPSSYLQRFSPALLFSYILHLCYTWENVHTNRIASRFMILYSLTIWCWMLCIYNTQHDAQIAERHIYIYLHLCSRLMLGAFKFQSYVFHYWHLIMVSKG